MSDASIGAMEQRLAELIAKRRMITKEAERTGRKRLDDSQDMDFRELSARIADLKESIEGAKEDRGRRAELSAGANTLFSAASKGNGMNLSGLQSIKESATYNPHNSTGPERRSFFRDVMAVSTPGHDVAGEAAGRLARHTEEMQNAGVETRTQLNTTTGDGGSFVPPAYLLDQYIDFARAGRPVANIVSQEALMSTMQVNIPKILTGTAVAAQSTQNTALVETDLTDSYVTGNVCTVGGNQVLSRQLLDQSPIAVDQVIFRDLISAQGAEVDRQVLNTTGSGNTLPGILSTVGIGAYTAANNTVASVYGALGQAISYIWKNRFLAPTAIVVSPARWGSWITQLDSESRPLFLPTANGPFNAAGLLRNVDAQGIVGEVLGVPVVVDAQLADNTAIVGRFSDAVLFEGGVRAAMYPQPLASQLSVLLSVWSYQAFVVRYAQSFVAITLSETPTYGS